MPRKSAKLRLSQSEELLAGYKEAGLGNSYQGRFITDVCRRLTRGKGLSKRQRDWIDSLIETGVPEPKGDPALIEKIDSAVAIWNNNPDRAWETNVVLDFKGRVIQGYDLSEKQTALLNKLLNRAVDDKSGANVFQPNEQEASDLKNLVALYKGYSMQWRNERPAVAKAVMRVENYLEGTGTIEVYHYDKLYKSMGSKLRKVNNPRWCEGDLGFLPIYDAVEQKAVSFMATCLTDVYVDEDGVISNDWLANGLVIKMEADKVRKRR